MIKIIIGDIFESNASAIVNPVNCDGAMCRGLSAQFKEKYPLMYTKYMNLCRTGRIRPGVLHYHNTPLQTIINFPTKDHWLDDSEYEYIYKGLECFRNTYRDFGISSVAFPALGCGEGRLKWADVCTMMHQALKDLPVDIEIWVTSDYRQNIYRQQNGDDASCLQFVDGKGRYRI